MYVVLSIIKINENNKENKKKMPDLFIISILINKRRRNEFALDNCFFIVFSYTLVESLYTTLRK
jgi:hypothetical protein